jgi:prolyl-tRNA editing enzyme YbaK/EbsC (Cys-tRNA(Pro) deacylase)
MSLSTPASSLERVIAAASTLDLGAEVRTLSQSTRTASEAAEACACEVGQIVKSLVFEDEASGELVLMLVSGDHAVDSDHMRSAYGLRLKRCDPRRVRDETGFAIGGVAPIGHIRPIRTMMDIALMDHPLIWAAAGRPDSVFCVQPEKLRSAIDPEMVSVRPPQDGA